MPLHLVLNISSRWEKLCEIFPIIGGLNVFSCCTIHNLFLDVQCMSAKASISGKLSCHCKTFHNAIHCHFFTSSLGLYLKHVWMLVVTGSMSWPWLRAVYTGPMADSDWPRWSVRPHSPRTGALGNWLVFTQNTPHMGWADECYYATGHTHNN